MRSKVKVSNDDISYECLLPKLATARGVGVVGDLISVSMSRVCAVLLLVAMNAIMILIRY